MFGSRNFLFTPIVAGGGGQLWAWGNGAFTEGMLGLGNTYNYSSPKQVGALTGWSFLGSGTRDASLAIKNDGTLWSWGLNDLGQLGLGNKTNYSSPKQIGSGTTWARLAVGFSSNYKNTAAIKTDGTFWTWGQNTVGQLGLNDLVNRSSPVQVGSLTNWKYASVGNRATFAIKTDGTLWSWGRNNSGALGLGDTVNRSSPVQVGALTNWSKISGSSTCAAAVKTDGTLWTWGAANYGALGLGNTTAYSSPKQIGSGTTWATVSMGYLSCLAVKTDGTLWAWGLNTDGQSGLANITNNSSPIQVGAGTTWDKVSASRAFALAIKTDKTLWAWGKAGDYAGQLGLGNKTNYSSPKQVGALTKWLSVAAQTAYGNVNAIRSP